MSMRFDFATIRHHFASMGAAYLVLGISLIPTLVASYRVHENVKARDEARFDQMVRGIQERMLRDLDNSVTILQGTRGLFVASGDVKLDEWQSYVLNVNFREASSGINDIGFIQRVSKAELPGHIAKMRSELKPDYSLSTIPAEAEEFFPIIYLANLRQDFPNAAGWNAGAEPARRAAMEQACDSGNAVRTSKVRLYTVPGTNLTQGLVVYLPVYAQGTLPQTIEERRRQLVGFVFGTYVAEDLGANVFGTWGDRVVHCEIYDGTRVNPETLLYSSSPGDSHPEEGLKRTFFVNRLGRPWIVQLSTLPAFDLDSQKYLRWVVLVGGLAATCILFGIAWMLARSRTRAEAMTAILRKSEAALRESEARFRRLAENAADVVYRFRFEPNRVCEYISPAVQTIFGYSPEEVYAHPDLVLDRMHPEDRAALGLDPSRSLLFHRAVAMRWYRKDGALIWVEMRNVPLLEKDGRIVAMEGIARDITEDKVADEKIKAAHDYARNLLESSIDMIISVDGDRRIQEFNPAAEETFGYKKSEVLNQTIDLLYASPDEGRNIYETTLRSGKFTGEVRNRRKSGRIFVSFLTASVLRDKNNAVIGLMGVSRDITERKQAEEALRKADAFYRTLVESIPQSLFRKDLKGRFTFANSRFCASIGCTPQEILGKTDFDFYPHALAVQYREADKKVMQTEEILDQVEQYQPPGRDPIYVHVIKTPIRESSGEIIGIQGIFWDVTEKKRAEDALAAEKERLAVTLRSIGDAVITTDTSGRILLINRVAEKLTGWSSEEAVGKHLSHVFRIVHESTREACPNPVEKVIQTGEIIGLANHTLLIARDGTERLIADSGAPIRDAQSRIIGVVLVFRDITETERFERELLKARKLESVGLLAGGIAHDFNNILTGILGNVSLSKVFGSNNPDLQERLAQAEKACLRARDLVQQLLIFAQGGEPMKKTISFEDLLRESAEFALRGANVRCQIQVTTGLWPVEADESQLIQVINNLVINASEAMPEGGVIDIAAENVAYDGQGGLPLAPGRYVKTSVR
ncbi:MAG: PAS domain S-box protein, partial [Verrucomicrobiota bacterium]